MQSRLVVASTQALRCRPALYSNTLQKGVLCCCVQGNPVVIRSRWARDEGKITALMVACRAPQREAAEFLLLDASDVIVQTRLGVIALNWPPRGGRRAKQPVACCRRDVQRRVTTHARRRRKS